MALRLIEAPSALPVTLTEIKSHAVISHSADDALLAALLKSAVEQAQQHTGRQLVTATWEMSLDSFPRGTNRAAAIEIPRPPLQEIVSISYLDTDGASRTMLSGSYVVDASPEPGIVFPSLDTEWPDTLPGKPNAVSVRFVAGWAMDAAVSPAAWTGPDGIKTWICSRVSTLYAHRETLPMVTALNQIGELPFSFVDCLLSPYIVRGVI